MVSKPPVAKTAARGARLRSAFALLVAALLASAGAANARGSGIRVLVDATVADAALPVMSAGLWQQDVERFVGAQTIPYSGSDVPTAAACRAAGADYLVVAPFALRPRLPGMPNDDGRTAAMSRIVATNCLTGNTTFDHTFDFTSDPPSKDDAGDFETSPETLWAVALPTTLARTSIPFAFVAHVTQVRGAFVLVDTRHGNLKPGDVLRDFSTGDRTTRTTPIYLTVTQVFDDYVQATFAESGPQPARGDFVELVTPVAPQPKS